LLVESAFSVDGPWSEVSGNDSMPFRVSLSDTARFFRLRQR
jgi:hypothetical protein